jgi:amidase
MYQSESNILVEALSLGTLGGVTVVVKDCIDIAGYATRSGSGALMDRDAAQEHADVVAGIVQGGGHIVGKASMHELAYGVTGINRLFGTPVNPRFPTLIPGGSSSGSAAAVASGLAQIAIGSDTGGSIRMPATCCGVLGLKPTFGRVSRKGCEPAESSLDCIGPFARDVAGLELAMRLIDPSYVSAPAPAVLRLGKIATCAQADVDAAVDRALVQVSGTVVVIDLPLLEEAFQAGITIMAAECWSAFGMLTGDPRMGEDVRARLLAAQKVTQDQVAQAEQVRTAFATAVDDALAEVDILVLPTLPAVPPALDELGDAAAILRLTALVRPFNLSGHPALSIPIEGPNGRPAGMQIVAKRGADAQLCAVARSILKETP